MERPKNKAVIAPVTLAGICWAVAVVAGLAAMARYEYTAGASAVALRVWPAKCALARDPGLPTLVMTLHPRCPCSASSLEELAELAARVQGRAKIYALFTVPEHADEDWTDTANWKAANSIAGANVLADEGGVESQHLGAKTSGQVLLFDSEGACVFEGGITVARGHVGANVGLDSVASLIQGTATAIRRTPVFGCALVEPACAGAPDHREMEQR